MDRSISSEGFGSAHEKELSVCTIGNPPYPLCVRPVALNFVQSVNGPVKDVAREVLETVRGIGGR